MRTVNFALISVAPLLLLAGCNSPAPGMSGPSNPSMPGQTASGGVPPIQLCEQNCEKAPMDRDVRNPNWHPIPLTSVESNSLNRVIPRGAPIPNHLHASVVNGNLAFSSDAEPYHAASTTTTLNLPAQGGQPARQLKVVATPEAAALLHQKISGPHY